MKGPTYPPPVLVLSLTLEEVEEHWGPEARAYREGLDDALDWAAVAHIEQPENALAALLWLSAVVEETTGGLAGGRLAAARATGRRLYYRAVEALVVDRGAMPSTVLDRAAAIAAL